MLAWSWGGTQADLPVQPLAAPALCLCGLESGLLRGDGGLWEMAEQGMGCKRTPRGVADCRGHCRVFSEASGPGVLGHLAAWH